MKNPAFAAWSFRVVEPTVEVVMPDGCRDVLVVAPQGADPYVVLTPLDGGPRRAALRAGTALHGFRLRPGTTLDLRALQGRDVGTIAAWVPDLVEVHEDLVHALDALAEAQRVRQVAAAIGVSTRTLQRLLHAHHLPGPAFWRQLGRARASARLLATDRPLADVALDVGYSDQAHLSREVRRWFGVTPQRLRSTPGLLEALDQPGLGNWTVEQSSTR